MNYWYKINKTKSFKISKLQFIGLLKFCNISTENSSEFYLNGDKTPIKISLAYFRLRIIYRNFQMQ